MKGMAVGTKNFLIVMIILAFFLIGPSVLAEAFPVIKIMLLAFFAYEIYKFVEEKLGKNIMTYAISGILIYVFVIVLWPFFMAAYFLSVIMAIGLMSPILFSFQIH